MSDTTSLLYTNSTSNHYNAASHDELHTNNELLDSNLSNTTSNVLDTSVHDGTTSIYTLHSTYSSPILSTRGDSSTSSTIDTITSQKSNSTTNVSTVDAIATQPHRPRATKRTTSQLTPAERWYCTNYGCNKIFKRTSTVSISHHKMNCKYIYSASDTTATTHTIQPAMQPYNTYNMNTNQHHTQQHTPLLRQIQPHNMAQQQYTGYQPLQYPDRSTVLPASLSAAMPTAVINSLSTSTLNNDHTVPTYNYDTYSQFPALSQQSTTSTSDGLPPNEQALVDVLRQVSEQQLQQVQLLPSISHNTTVHTLGQLLQRNTPEELAVAITRRIQQIHEQIAQQQSNQRPPS